MTKEIESKAETLRHEPVFRLKPKQNEPDEMASCEIKHVGFINQNEKLGDEPIEISDNKNNKFVMSLGTIDGYQITVRAYRVNMTGHYMVNHNRLPMCCLQFLYAKTILSGSLFTLFVYLNLDKFKNSFLTKPQSYVGATVYGKYTLVLDTDNEIGVNELKELTDKFCEKYAIEEFASKLDENKNLSEEEILEKIQILTEEKKIFYNQLIAGKSITHFNKFNPFVKEHLLDVAKSSSFLGLIKYGLHIRSKKRNEEYGAYNKEYTIPQKVFNVSEYEKNPEMLDKYLNIDENNDSDKSDNSDNSNKSDNIES
jgi:hypothetical protein